jgi:hypothetical protein
MINTAAGILGALLLAGPADVAPVTRQQVVVVQVTLENRDGRCIVKKVPDLVGDDALKRDQYITWNVTNTCAQAVRVRVAKFMRCKDERCGAFAAKQDPCDGAGETAGPVPPKDPRGIFRQVHGAPALAPAAYYKYSIFAGGYELDPRIQITE